MDKSPEIIGRLILAGSAHDSVSNLSTRGCPPFLATMGASAAHQSTAQKRAREGGVVKRLRSVTKRSVPRTSNPERRRLFLLATAFVARGMEADEAYRQAVYYVHGAGRGRNWISAITAQDHQME